MNLKSKNIDHQLPAYIMMLVLAALVLGSMYWYQERMLFIDPAFILFEIINGKSFIISEHRYVAVTTQSVPLIGVLLGVSLKTLLLLYSLSFNLFYLLVGYLLIIRWKELGLGLLLVSYLTLHVSDGFFWPNNEVHQGIAWGLLALGYFRQLSNKKAAFRWQHYLVLIISVFLATNAHLLSCLVLLFSYLFTVLEDFSETKKMPDIKKKVLGILIISGIGFRLLLSYNSWYDGEKLSSVKGFTFAKAKEALSNPHAQWMYDALAGPYSITLLFIVLGVIILIHSRKYLLLLLYSVALLLYFDLVCMTFPESVERYEVFYLESQWTGLALIAALPLAICYIKPNINLRGLSILLAAVFVFRMVLIVNASDYFENRLENLSILTNRLSEKACEPVRITSHQDLRPFFILDWGLPLETLILSNLKSEYCSVSLKIHQSPIPQDTSFNFHAPFKVMPMEALNKSYFEYKHWQGYRSEDENILLGFKDLGNVQN